MKRYSPTRGNVGLFSGQAMAGAGGGGFIFVLTKEPNMVDEVKAVIKSMKVEVLFSFSS